MSMSNPENLLGVIAKISAKYTPAQTHRLNLLEILGVNADEQKICRLLYELLPSWSHGTGNIMLKLLCRDVLSSIDINDYEFDGEEVFR